MGFTMIQTRQRTSLLLAVDFIQALKLGFDVHTFLYVFRTLDKVNEICVVRLAK